MLEDLVRPMLEMRIDKTEYVLVKMINLFVEGKLYMILSLFSDLGLTEAGRTTVAKARDRYLHVLYHHIRRGRDGLATTTRLARLMLIISTLTVRSRY